MATSKASSRTATAQSLTSSQRTAAVEKARAANIAATGTSTKQAPRTTTSSGASTVNPDTVGRNNQANVGALNTPTISPTLPQGRTGEGLTIDKATNSVVGVTSGKNYGTAATLQGALDLQTQIQSGGSSSVPLTKVRNTTELDSFAKLGLTESDITRDGKDIYLNRGITEDYLKARSAKDVTFSAPIQQEGATYGTDALDSTGQTTIDDSFFSGDASTPSAFVKSLESLYKTFEGKIAEIQAKVDKEAEYIAGVREDIGNRSEFLDQTREEFGVKDKMHRLEDINLQIAQKVGAYLQLEVDTQGQAIPMGLLIGQGAALQRQKAADIGALTAVAAAYTDNINLANSLVAQTLDVEFGAQQAQLDATYQLLNLYQDQLSSEEQKQATKVGAVLDERQRILDIEREDKKSLYDLMIGIAQAGGDTSVIDTKKSLEENIRNAESEIAKIGAAEETSITDAQRLSAAQTLLNSGAASTLDDALSQVDNALGGVSGASGTTGETSYATADGTFDIDTYASSVGSGTVTQDFDTPVDYFVDGRTTHGGYDIDGAIGDDVTAPVSGSVIEAGENSGWGNTIVIEDSAGNRWRMAHFDSLNVAVGDSVSSGQSIGAMGNTGHVLSEGGGDGSHLHLEVKDGAGKLVDPKTMSVGNAKVTQEQGDAVTNAAENLIPWLSDKDAVAVRRTVNRYVQEGNLAAAVELLQSSAIGGLAATEQQKAFGRLQSLRALDDIESSLAAYVEKNGDTNLLKGAVEGYQEKVLKSTGDQELAKIANDIQLAIIAYRGSVSGAAFTEQEIEQYNSVFPSTGKTPALNAAKIASLRQAFDRNQRTVMEVVIGATNYNELFGDYTENKYEITNPKAKKGFFQKILGYFTGE